MKHCFYRSDIENKRNESPSWLGMHAEGSCEISLSVYQATCPKTLDTPKLTVTTARASYLSNTGPLLNVLVVCKFCSPYVKTRQVCLCQLYPHKTRKVSALYVEHNNSSLGSVWRVVNPSRSKVWAFNLISGVYLTMLSVTQCCTASTCWLKNEFWGNVEDSLLKCGFFSSMSEADHSAPSRVVAKIEWSCTSFLPYTSRTVSFI
jgi:hypothetical protein